MQSNIQEQITTSLMKKLASAISSNISTKEKNLRLIKYNDDLKIPEAVKVATNEYIDDNNPIKDFEIAGSDKVFVPANAKIVGNKISVCAKEISKPKYVRYAWRDTSEASFFNKEGLPAASFTTEK